MHPPEVVTEMKKNRAAFDRIKEQMEANSWGKTILLHDGGVVTVCDDRDYAYSIGCEKFGLGRFSLHRVGEQPIDLGIHALPLYQGD